MGNDRQVAGRTLRAVLAAGLAALALVGGEAQAGTATGSFAVTATVTANCTVTGTTLAFGAYDPTAIVDLDAATTLSVKCTKGTVVASVELDNGLNGVGVQRSMKNGTDLLNFNLFTDAGHATSWTNVVLGAGFTSAGPSTPNIVNVYGRIPQGQNVPLGAYTDTVVATVNF